MIHDALQAAAYDFRFLLNRGYPRDLSLQLVGNRHNLTKDLRHILRRGVFDDESADQRMAKTIPIEDLRGESLVVDGHNVLITVESALRHKTLVRADDGFIRDIAGMSGRYRKGRTTDRAMGLIIDLLAQVSPASVLFLFDAPISGSGELASWTRAITAHRGIPGDARAVKVPETSMRELAGIIASSDTDVIDHAVRVCDLAGAVIRHVVTIPVITLGGRG